MEARQQQADFDKPQLVRLVRGAKRGDRQALAELFARYRRAVYHVAYRRLGNDAEAQELCQEVFIQAIRKMAQLDNPLCFGGWVRAIANRMAINRAVRSRRAWSLESDCQASGGVEEETPLARILARERRDQVRLGLERLSALDRDTLLAFYFRGRSLVQMSDEFDRPVGTIKRRLCVARRRLARQLEALAPA